MSIFITKIKLYNFRRFREFVIEPNTKNNILIGDNESGKSTILEAIDLVSGGNNRRVEAIGLDNLLNIEAVTEFINSDRCYADLPKLRVELYLSGASDPSVNGENNSDKIECDGIKLVCEPNEDYKTEITSAMDAQSDYFPYVAGENLQRRILATNLCNSLLHKFRGDTMLRGWTSLPLRGTPMVCRKKRRERLVAQRAGSAGACMGARRGGIIDGGSNG